MRESDYVDEQELRLELSAWEASAEAPEDRTPSERLGQILMSLHDNVLRNRSFNKYRQALKEEMKSYSLFRIIKRGLATWREGKGRAFSYFTRAIFQNYITVLRKYYRHINLHREYVKGQLMKIAESGDQKVINLLRHFQGWDE